jgi:hypothetical protein
MWKDVNEKYYKTRVKVWIASIIVAVIFALFIFIGVKFGSSTLSISLSILLGLIGLFFIYWIIKIIILLFKNK